MLKIKTFALSLVAVMGLAFFTSCEKPEGGKVDNNAPKINLEQTELNVGYEGGTYRINFTITNPVEGQSTMATPSENWISDVFVDDVNGVITFDVATNSSKDSRSAVLEVNYQGVEKPVQVTITQSGDTTPEFEMVNVETTFREVTFDLLPLHKNRTYVMNVNSKNYIIDEGLEDDEALFQDDMAYFEYLGYWHGQSAVEIMAERAKEGDVIEQVITSCAPGTDYVLYAYYVDLTDGTRTSDITRFTVTTRAVELTNVEFEIDYTVNEAFVDVEIAPQDYSGSYYFDMLPADAADAYVATYGVTLEKYFEIWWNSNVTNDINNGFFAEEIISNYCSAGSDSHVFDLLQTTRYYLVSFAVEGHAYCASTPKFLEITTSTVSPSDLVVTPYVNNIRSIKAEIGYTASNDDPYVSGLISAEEFETLGSSEQAKIASLLRLMDPITTSTGSYKGEVKGLTPETEYVVFAFGFRGGVATTQMYTTTFTTLSDEPGAADLTMTNTIGYFDLYDIAEVYPTYAGTAQTYGDVYAFYPVEFTINPLGSKPYYVTYTWDSKAHYEQFINENPNYLIEQLLRDGVKPVGRQLLWVEYGKYNTIIYMAEDSEGRYSEMHVAGFDVSKSGVSDIQLFVDWNEGTSNVAPNYVELPQDIQSAELTSSLQVLSNGVEAEVEAVAVENDRVRYSAVEMVSEVIPSANELSPVR